MEKCAQWKILFRNPKWLLSNMPYRRRDDREVWACTIAHTVWPLHCQLAPWESNEALFFFCVWSEGVKPSEIYRRMKVQYGDIYNWINQLSNTTIWWLYIRCLLHRYRLHVSVLMAIFRLTDWQQTCKQLYFGMRLVYGRGGLWLDGGTRSRVCWVGIVMWVHGYYFADLTCFGSYGHLQVDRLTTNL